MNDNTKLSTRQEALKNNETFYFTGKECKHGHIDVRYAISGKCLTCQKKQSKQWNMDHKEIRDQWRHNNKEYIKRKYKESYENEYTKWLWEGLKAKSKRKGIPFEISIKDIVIPKFCPVLGIELKFNKGRSRDDSPSVDRIIPSIGYIPSNIIVVSCRTNRIKNDSTTEELLKIYNFYNNLV